MGWIMENELFMVSAILGLLALIVLFAILYITFSIITQRKKILAHVDTSAGSDATGTKILSATFFSLIAPITKFLARSKVYGKKVYERKNKKLKDGSFRITPYELLSLKIVVLFATFIIVSLFILRDFKDSNQMLIVFFIPILSFLVPDLYILFKSRAKINYIKKDFVVAVKILSNSMQGGYSIPQAMKAVSKTLKGPMAHEFDRMHKEIELGFSIEESLSAFASRTNLEQTKMLAIIISINNIVGGDVIEAFQNAIESIEVTTRIKTKVRVATASARTSLKIIISIPIVLFFAITLITGGEYFLVFTESWLGWTLLITAIFLQIIGFLIIRRMSRIEI